MKISVIIPVYNSEKYIEKCLDSILNQTIENIEIIVVNDKSTDNSKAIIMKYCDEYKNIIFIDKETNEGVSAARNDALKVATGKYISFIDADDWIESDMLEKLYIEAETNNLDIAICNHFVENEDGNNQEIRKINLSSDTIFNGMEMTKEVMTAKNNLQGFVWNKIFKLELIKSNKIEFNSELNYLEDLIFNIKILLNSEGVKIINKPLYHYIQRQGSITKTYNHNYIISIDDIGNEIKTYLESKEINLQQEYYNLMTRVIIIAILNIVDSQNSKKEKVNLISNIFKNKDNINSIKNSDKSYLTGYQRKICNILIRVNFNASIFLNTYMSLIKIKKLITRK